MAVKAILNEDQKDAFKAIQKFISHPAANTFVLKGYAGTGKTFLMQHLALWLSENEYKFSLLASTGRAAAVLRGKTGITTKTVHSELYRLHKVDGADNDLPDGTPEEQYGQMTLLFSLRPPDNDRRIYIVDESSMLSNYSEEDVTALSFGSGNLLGDFFAAAGSNKIIFVGDPGQLPPVRQIFSPALEMDWLAKQQRIGVTTTLKKIERNNPDNDILALASIIRDMSLAENPPTFPSLPALNMNNVRVLADDKVLFRSYFTKFQEVGADGTIAIARSNKTVSDINRAFRRDKYGKEDISLQVGEILLVTHNNYAYPLTNGDFVSVCEVGELSIVGNLQFQKIKIKALLSGTEFDMIISLDILYGNQNNFSEYQARSLMIDFNRRMKKKKIKPNSQKYKDKMMKDDILNCLRAKYGYAVTCHKAQGGEWNDVFLFLDKKMYGMSRPELFRWWYTAVTRAKRNLYLSNNWWIR